MNPLHELIFTWARGLLTPGRPFVLGVNGPQGGGKSTLTAALCARFGAEGLRAVTISVDDFYLTRDAQGKLAAAHLNNPYLQLRGYPGTHDVTLGERTLEKLRSTRLSVVRIPRYDKSAHGGLGDRAAESEWPEVRTPLDLILFEGWMLGFTPVHPAPADPSLREVNELLRPYAVWTSHLDGFLQLDPLDHEYVLDWRVEAEERMKASGKTGMTTAEARAYIEKFLPAYGLWLPGLRKNPPTANARRVVVGKDRQPAG